MQLERLVIQGLRCLSDVELAPVPGINLFVGANGAGKTSILEAAFLLSHARSFRSGAKEALMQRGVSRLSLFAEVRHPDRQAARLGLGKTGARWEARRDGSNITVGELVESCAVVCFEPGSHALISGPSEERRRYLDWGVFHVEHDFLSTWRRYQRALKQRNSLLRTGGTVVDELAAPWEAELAQTAHRIDQLRRDYLARLREELRQCTDVLLPELGVAELRYRRGWAEDVDLAQQLRDHRGRDAARGHTTSGAHRADWSIGFEQAPLREHLSRGQEKLTALACVLAQARLYSRIRGEWPVVCLDDLASELDRSHQFAVVGQLVDAKAQVLVTGTEAVAAMDGAADAMFHVEQGEVTRLL